MASLRGAASKSVVSLAAGAHSVLSLPAGADGKQLDIEVSFSGDLRYCAAGTWLYERWRITVIHHLRE